MKKKVLIIDDNPKNLMLERDLMEVAGYEVFEAENATDGIALARKERLDIIILDVRLPDMRGPKAALIIREQSTKRNIPIVFVTASVMPVGMDEIKTITKTGFILKPINTRTFANEISQYLIDLSDTSISPRDGEK